MIRAGRQALHRSAQRQADDGAHRRRLGTGKALPAPGHVHRRADHVLTVHQRAVDIEKDEFHAIFLAIVYGYVGMHSASPVPREPDCALQYGVGAQPQKGPAMVGKATCRVAKIKRRGLALCHGASCFGARKEALGISLKEQRYDGRIRSFGGILPIISPSESGRSTRPTRRKPARQGLRSLAATRTACTEITCGRVLRKQ